MEKAGIEKKFLSINNNDSSTTFCYLEKGRKVEQQPSIIFIHGFSSDKYTWLNIIKVCFLYLILNNLYILII